MSYIIICNVSPGNNEMREYEICKYLDLEIAVVIVEIFIFSLHLEYPFGFILANIFSCIFGNLYNILMVSTFSD